MLTIAFLIFAVGLALYAFLDALEPVGARAARQRRNARQRELNRSAKEFAANREARRARRHGGAR